MALSANFTSKSQKMKLTNSLIAVAILLSTTGSLAQNADDIMKKHEQAVGGADKWGQINTLKMKGSMSQGGMQIDLTQTVAAGKAMRTDISVMGMSGFIIITKDGGWQYMPFMGVAKLDTLKPDMVASSQKQLDLKGQQMLDYKAKGINVEYVNVDTIKKAPCFKLKFTNKDGDVTYSYFDCTSYHLVRTESKAKLPDGEEQEVSVDLGEYKSFDGIAFPTLIKTAGAEVAFSSIEINKPIDESVFKPIIPQATEEKK